MLCRPSCVSEKPSAFYFSFPFRNRDNFDIQVSKLSRLRHLIEPGNSRDSVGKDLGKLPRSSCPSATRPITGADTSPSERDCVGYKRPNRMRTAANACSAITTRRGLTRWFKLLSTCKWDVQRQDRGMRSISTE